MRKKILCAIISVVMLAGVMTGCGSSKGDTIEKGDTVEKVEESIMTQIIPGESTADELENYLQGKGVVWENNTKGQPRNCTNSDYFLGHEAKFSEFKYANEKVYAYRVEVVFKNVDDYKTGLNEIKGYFEKMGTGITGYNDDEGADKEPIKCYLLEDENDYYTAVLPWVGTYDKVQGDYYNSILKFVYYRVDKNNQAEETVLWKDKDGNSYSPKFDKSGGKSANSADSTELSHKADNDMTAWKQAYIDYINKMYERVGAGDFKDCEVTSYKFVDINTDGQPELCLVQGGRNQEYILLNYTKSKDVQVINSMHTGSSYGGNTIIDNYKSTGTARDYVYSYNSSTGEFDRVFYGKYGYNQNNTAKTNNYRFVGLDNSETKTTKEEYEGKLKEAKGNTEFTPLGDGFSSDDVITAIKNYK